MCKGEEDRLMGQYVTFDPVTRIIQIDVAPSLVEGEYVNDLDFQVDFYSDGKEDYKTDSEFSKITFPIIAIGGQPTVGGKFLGATYFINPTWKIRPYESDHRNILRGNIYSEDGKSVWKPTVGSYNVSNEIEFTNLIDVVSTGGSLLQSGDLANIADAVLDEQMGGHNDAGSLAVFLTTMASDITTLQTFMERTLGLSQENQAIDQMVYTNGRLTSSRIRIYSSAGSVGTDNDVIATYTMSATYSGENLETYSVVKQ